MNKIINLLKNRSAQNQLILAFGGLLLALMLMFLILQIYTRHGREINAPDLTGMTLDKVDSLLHAEKLHYVVSDSTFIPGKKPGIVIDQNPSANTKVKHNRKLFLVINAKKPVQIKMPNVVGVSLRQAESVLQNCGLHVGKKIYVPDIARDYVLRQYHNGREIPHGSNIVKGSSVDLVLGSGYGRSN